MSKNFYGATDPGRIRTNNEDVFLAMELQNGMIAAAAIDGVGGYEGGEIASATAKEAVEEILRHSFQHAEETIIACLHLANRRIFEAKTLHPQAANMACVITLALADIGNNEFHYIHTGDTRLYLLRADSLIKQTSDQSFVGYLEDSGRISEQEAMRHPKRNEINKALGFDPLIHQKGDYLETGSSPFLPGDLLLLCSDGLTDMIDSELIVAILTGRGSLKEKTDKLIAAANDAGGKDNITVVLVKNDKQPSSHEATRPAQAQRSIVRDTEQSPAAVKHIAVAESSVTPQVSSPPVNKNGLIIFFLALLSAGLGAALIWTMSIRNATVTSASAAILKPLTQQEQLLRQALDRGTDTLILDSSIYLGSIVLTDTIPVNNDSIYIRGSGCVISADSSFKGPGLIISARARYIHLDNIVFKDFPVAILNAGKSLRLSNVRFINCSVPVQHNLPLPEGGPVNTTISDSLITLTDSLSLNPAI